MEVINVVATVRVPGGEIDHYIRKISSGEVQVITVPPNLRRRTVEKWPSGSTDPNWPQIKVEYMK